MPSQKLLQAVAMLASLALASTWNSAHAQIRFNFEAQPMSTALARVGELAHINVLFDSALVDKLWAPPLKADTSSDEALARLLSGTGLRILRLDEKTFTVVKESEVGREHAIHMRVDATYATPAYGGTPEPSLGDARAQRSEISDGASSEDVRSRRSLAEVIVSAQKREESVQDVPVPVAVLGADELVESNQLRLQDYFSKVPGLNLTIGGAAGDPILSIRGINNGNTGGSPSIGVVIDDVPYGSSVGLGARGQPNIDPGDLSRVEVLRGPQGTLYGASSIGGLLKYVTADPSPSGLSGRVQAGTTSLFNGVDPGYNFRGSLNVPMNEVLALRASAFVERNPGYIENIQTGQHGINRRTNDGGRLALSWNPSDALSVKLSALIQDSKRDGADVAVAGPGFGDLQLRTTPNTGTFDEKTQAYSATLNAKIGVASLTSLTGYNIDQLHSVLDTTRVLQIPDVGGFWDFLANTFSNTTGPGSLSLYSAHTRKFSQELRLSMPIADHFDWLLGAFFTDEKNDARQVADGADPTTGVPGAIPFLDLYNTIKYDEYAAFTNLTYSVTSRLDVQFGGRASRNKQTSDAFRSGPAATLFFSTPATTTPSTGNSFTYLVTPRYKVSPDIMVYARLASGYRPGGANGTCTTGIPCQYEDEKTENYDLGLKGDFLNHVISVDTSLYYIAYKNIQVGLVDPSGTLSYTANFGRAKSQGVEISVEARPIGGLTLDAWVAWDDAEFTARLPPAAGDAAPRPGDRLPFSSRFSGNFSADEEFAINGLLTAFVGGTVSYVGERRGGIYASPTPQTKFPPYAQTDLRAGVKYNTWTITAFVNNAGNRRGILMGGMDYQYTYPDANAYSYIQPRTVGLNASKTF